MDARSKLSLSAPQMATVHSMKLVLENGVEFIGDSFGADVSVAGEVVFNTGMTGYVETLTDPSYRGQILVTTYPLQGNYGVPSCKEVFEKSSLESSAIQVQGLVVLNYCDHPSHFDSKESLGEWLRRSGIPAVQGIDTRALTRILREHGTMRGTLMPADSPTANATCNEVNMQEVCSLVTVKEVRRYEAGRTKILLIDSGAKDSIVRSMLKRETSVIRVPYHVSLKDYVSDVDGILLSNGPGDPKDMLPLVHQIRSVLFPLGKPIFGVCLGNQLLGLAAGGDTMKLKYGHRSQNQPVIDLMTRACYVTSQNHGYVVKEESLPREWSPWFVNVNDGSNEGIFCRNKPWSSVQFHPEASPGPEDAAFLFDRFLDQVGATST